MKNFLANILNKQKNGTILEDQYKRISPNKHWTVMVWAFLFLLIPIAAFNYWLFFHFLDKTINNFSPKNVSSKMEAINISGLKNAIKIFSEKKSKFDKLLEKKPSTIDPST